MGRTNPVTSPGVVSHAGRELRTSGWVKWPAPVPAAPAGALADGQWHHVAATPTGTYVDGKLRATGEGGTYVLAVTGNDLSLPEGGEVNDGPFEFCATTSLPRLSHNSLLVDSHPLAGEACVACPHCEADTVWDEFQPADRCPSCQQHLGDDEQVEDAHFVHGGLTGELFPWLDDENFSAEDRRTSVALLGAVCLGSANGCWMTEDGNRWECSREDLTSDGAAFVEMLERLHGRPVTLLTMVDT